MSDRAAEVRTAGLAFGTLGAVVSSLWAVRKVSTAPNPDWQLYLTVVVAATVLAACFGAVAWWGVVARFDRWSVPTRGAIAGALTIWGTFTFLAPIAAMVDSGAPTGVLEALALAALMATVVMAVWGVFFLPFGVLTGYLLGRRQADDPGPIPIVARFR